METRIVIFAAVLCSLLALYQVTGEPLEDSLPDTTGLFFGKRNSHPNMNNLLFGRRSYAALAAKLNLEDARHICRSVRTTCAKWGMEDDDVN